MRVLTKEDWEFWEENGYVVVSDAVPQKNLDALVQVLWDFQEMDPGDPSTWYREPARRNQMEELNYSGMVELYHHQALWDNRQYPRVYDAFVDLLGTEKLWVTIDRANLNVPARPGWDFRGFIHWDIDTSIQPLPFQLQGVLSLTGTTADQGGFQCVPGFHRRIGKWIKAQPPDRDPWRPDTTGMTIRQVETRAGDLLVWQSTLPHGTGRNRSNRPRLAQYISMFPARPDDFDLRRWRIQSWRQRLPPRGFAFPGDPRELERKAGVSARLTDLGERLLGLKDWSQ